MAAPSSSNVDVFADFLIGSWKRNLEWRIFGSNFPHLRTSNTVVKVEAYSSAAQEPNVRLLKWSFGKSLEADELRFGYVIRFAHDPTSEQTRLDWQYGGESCQGVYNSVTRTAVLNFFLRTSTVTITYRVLDADSMACTIVEVDESSAPTIQYGHMLRIDQTLYPTAGK